MRVVFLVKGLKTPRTRYRVLPYAARLEQEGAAVDVADIPRRIVARWRLLASLGHADAVVVQKKLFGAVDFRLLRSRARRLIFDVDDAVMVRAEPGRHGSVRRSRRFARTVRECDLVFAGNGHLAGMVRSLGGRVVVVPTAVDLERYPEPDWEDRSGPRPRIRLGWIGSASTLPHLVDLAPVFRALAEARVEADLTVICSTFPPPMGIPVVERSWSEATEVRDLWDLDIGLAPLPDDPWTRGKSATKVVQYMAAGLPVVCSPVGANAEIVRHGVTGYHAATPEEWVRWIRLLAEDPGLRLRMGRAGRERVVSHYSVQALFPRVWSGLRGREPEAVAAARQAT